MRTVAIWTIKGGVGKTTAAVNLAFAAASQGVRVLLWDLDPQGAASFYLRAVPQISGGTRTVTSRSLEIAALAQPTDFDNLCLLPADLSFRNIDVELDTKKRSAQRLADKLATLGDRFDLVVLDCAPSLSLVSEAIVAAADLLLVPVIPSTLSTRTLDQVRCFVAETCPDRVLVLPFLSMVDRRKRMHQELATELLQDPGVLRTEIPFSSRIERMGQSRAPVAATHASHPAAKVFARLWAEVATHLEKTEPSVQG